jgi:aspartyl/asparaginyl beta-hydroxylase (cupin superfamily)
MWRALLLVCAAVCVLLCVSYGYGTKMLDQPFYTTDQICPTLESVHALRPQIAREVEALKGADSWTEWPEHHLYKSGEWRVMPFFAFGTWMPSTCAACPTLTGFLRSIPRLRTAILSRLSPGTSLSPHRGWAKHSNYVLRGHYGLFVKDGCTITVEGETREHRQGEWIVFDDSKTHTAANFGSADRVVLIVDVERPVHVRRGASTVKDTSELTALLEHFKQTAASQAKVK